MWLFQNLFDFKFKKKWIIISEPILILKGETLKAYLQKVKGFSRDM